MEPNFCVFNPQMENIYSGAQPPSEWKRTYTQTNNYVEVSRGHYEYSPSQSLDQQHPSPSMSPEPDSDSQMHPHPPIQNLPMAPPGSDLQSLTPVPASAAPPSPLPSPDLPLPTPPSGAPTPSTKPESAPGAQPPLPIIPEPAPGVVKSFELLQGHVPIIGGPEYAEKSHFHDLEDSEYDKLLEGIIQWA
ncbi:hypothetical protein EDB19DRAFT_2002933 [Suillus lakei]|nr:hypothetical protein EDB19DRAFT_2002933 [Suillus lakei]